MYIQTTQMASFLTMENSLPKNASKQVLEFKTRIWIPVFSNKIEPVPSSARQSKDLSYLRRVGNVTETVIDYFTVPYP